MYSARKQLALLAQYFYGGVFVRQVFRFFFKPWTFFNQLQWSSNHTFILIAFVSVALIENLLGKNQALYTLYLPMFQNQLHLSETIAIWAITFAKLLIMFLATYLLTWIVWFLGSLLGKSNSRRVLFRRMAMVMVVLLISQILQHLARYYPALELVSAFIFTWSFILALFAIKEHFDLRWSEGIIITGIVYVSISLFWLRGHQKVYQWAYKQIEKQIAAQVHSLKKLRKY